MNDTPKEIWEKQVEIILSKTTEERMKMGFDMIDSVYEIVKNSIRIKKPELSEREVVAEIFKRYYQDEFSPVELEHIASEIRKSRANHVID